MEMCDRKKRILQAIVDDYIKTAEPIGSRTIAKKHGLNLSSATIRNEMADLEEMGFLDKPHTSAGRIPSSMGYRFYVNRLMRTYSLSASEMAKLKNALEIQIREFDELADEVSDIISRLTNYTVIAVAPRPMPATIKNIRVSAEGENTVMVELGTRFGEERRASAEFSEVIPVEFVENFSAEISRVLTGISPYDLSAEGQRELVEASAGYPQLLNFVMRFLLSCFSPSAKKGIHTGGIVNIFNHPEYKDLERAREFISFIDNRENIYNIVSQADDNNSMNITIGNENDYEALKGCSVVISNYASAGGLKGSIGIIGPTRMDYARVISSLDIITDSLNNLIRRLAGE